MYTFYKERAHVDIAPASAFRWPWMTIVAVRDEWLYVLFERNKVHLFSAAMEEYMASAKLH